jgi:hypothetical protein
LKSLKEVIGGPDSPCVLGISEGHIGVDATKATQSMSCGKAAEAKKLDGARSDDASG